MIKKIDHSVPSEAEQIHRVFQVSYAVEARLLNAKEFPPLKRPIEKFINTDTIFYGYYEINKLAAVIEVKVSSNRISIHSLVVDPAFFRRGIATRLLEFLFQEFETNLFTVETGAANEPAIALYERHGFKLVNQWMTEIGIEKVAFEKRVN